MADPGPSAPAWRSALYWCCHSVVLVILMAVYRFRSLGSRRVPTRGPALIVSNHQSHFDPPAVACAIRHRQIHFLARETLFRHRVFGWLIRSLNSIPIDQSGKGDIKAVRNVLEALEGGAAVLVFPEGSRSFDGALQPFKRGAWLMVRRARCPVVPCAVEGAFDAFPRTRRFPRLLRQRVEVAFGEPIPHDELLELGEEGAMQRLKEEIGGLRGALRKRIRAATGGRLPTSDAEGGDGGD